LSTITRFSVRSSGRDISLVRRPAPASKAKPKVEKAAPEPKKTPLPATTKPAPESNDADVTTTDV